MVNPICPYTIRVAAGDHSSTVELLLDQAEETLLRAVARELDRKGEGSESSPRMYVERRFAGVRVAGEAAT